MRISLFVKIILITAVLVFLPFGIISFKGKSSMEALNELVVDQIESAQESIGSENMGQKAEKAQKAADDVNTLMMRLFFIVAILTIVISLLYSRYLTKPIIELRNGSKEIAKGNFDYKINIHRNDEIGDLAVSFEEMKSALKKSKEKLDKYNTGLKDEINKQTRELQEKVEELEKFNKFMINREIKMKELKEKNKYLEDKLKSKTT